MLPFATAGVSGDPGGAFDRAIERASSRVVKLYGLRAGMQVGYGTGVLVSEDGQIVTVSSLLIDARQIRAVTSDGSLYGADVVHRDSERQLALLALGPFSSTEGGGATEGVGPFPHFDLSVQTPLAPGDWVVAAGNAFKVADGAEPVSIAHGVFSARTRLDARRRKRDFPYHGDVLAVDAITSNPGAPGSALVNLDGALVGMVGRVVVSNLTHTNFNYAIPRDVLHAFYLEATGATEGSGDDGVRRFRERFGRKATAEAAVDLGIRLSQVGYRRVLPFVDRVRAGSPAETAGLRKDDLIVSVNGRSVDDVEACQHRLSLLEPEDALDLVVRRDRKYVVIHIEPEQP
jgi:S1-C subfamily serine protease